MIIDDITLDRIAKLASINIDDSEREKLKHDMTAILSWVDKLNEIDTSGIEPIIHMTTESNQFREDENDHNISIEESLRNAREKSDNYFIVPKVINKNNE
jgi:aspartyl-tRNA(Asn)/glutamyl-tRNA(Gln) amidotransferase subunit C